MTRSLRIGVVAEGPSDRVLISRLVERLFGADVEVRAIWPQEPLTPGRPYGWRGVRSWCEEFGPQLDVFMNGVEGDELDLMFVHVDCSMAQHVGARRPCPPARATADALRAEIRGAWLGLESLPETLVLVSPCQSAETWIRAALDTDPVSELECRDAEEIDRWFHRNRYLRIRDGQLKKPLRRYRPLVEKTSARWTEVKALCSEARRFEDEVELALRGRR